MDDKKLFEEVDVMVGEVLNKLNCKSVKEALSKMKGGF